MTTNHQTSTHDKPYLPRKEGDEQAFDLRDRFASRAMTVLLHRAEPNVGAVPIERTSYAIADAMMAARLRGVLK